MWSFPFSSFKPFRPLSPSLEIHGVTYWKEAAASVCALWLLISCLQLDCDAQVHGILSVWEHFMSASNVFCLLVLSVTIKDADVLTEALDRGTNWFYTPIKLHCYLFFIFPPWSWMRVALLSSSAVLDPILPSIQFSPADETEELTLVTVRPWNGLFQPFGCI